MMISVNVDEDALDGLLNEFNYAKLLKVIDKISNTEIFSSFFGGGGYVVFIINENEFLKKF